MRRREAAIKQMGAWRRKGAVSGAGRSAVDPRRFHKFKSLLGIQHKSDETLLSLQNC